MLFLVLLFNVVIYLTVISIMCNEVMFALRILWSFVGFTIFHLQNAPMLPYEQIKSFYSPSYFFFLLSFNRIDQCNKAY